MASFDRPLLPGILEAVILRNPLIIAPRTRVIDAIAQMDRMRAYGENTPNYREKQPLAKQQNPIFPEIKGSCAVVVEHQRVVGIFTAQDIVPLLAQQRPLEQLFVEQVIPQPVVTAQESNLADSQLLISLFQTHNIRHLPILNKQDELTGILTYEGLQQAIIQSQALRIAYESEPDKAQFKVEDNQSQVILKAVPDLIFRVGADGIYRGFVNRDRHFDVVESGINPTGQAMTAVLPTEMADRHLYYLQKALQTGEIQTYEQQLQLGGTWQYEEVNVIKNGDDEVLFVIRDVTELKQTEAALHKSEQTNRVLIESLPDVLILMDREGNYRHITGGDSICLPYLSEMSAPNIYSVLPHDSAEQQLFYIHQALETGLLQTYEQFFEFDGHPFNEEVRVTPLSEQEVLIIIRDITERKQLEVARYQAEQELHQLNQSLEETVMARTVALQEREQFLQTVLDTVPLSVCWKDRNSTYLGCNRHFLQDAGADSVADIVGMTDYDLPWAETEAEAYRGDDREVIASNTPKTGIFETQHRADGRQTFLATNKLPLHDLTGEVIGVLVTYQNISDRKQAEKNLHQYERIVAATADSMAVVDRNYIYCIVNQTYLDRSGKSYDQIVGSSVVNFMGETLFYEQIKPKLDRCFEGELVQYEDWFNFDYIGRRFVSVNYAPYREADGTISGALVSTRDITDRKLLEISLQNTTQQLQAFLAHAPVIISCFDREGRYLQVNAAFTDLLGVAEEDIIGHTFADFFPESVVQVFYKQIQTLIETQQPLQIEDEIPVNGMARTFQTILFVVPDEQGELSNFWAIDIDITERKQAEAKVNEMSQRLALATQSARIGIFDFDPVEDRLIWDDRMYELHGLTQAEFKVTYEAWKQCVNPDDKRWVEAAIQAAIAGEKNFHAEFRVAWPNHQMRCLETHATVLKDDAGNPQRVIGVSWDITHRKQAEAQLQNLIAGTAATTGQNFFPAFVEHIAKALDVPYALVSELGDVGLLHVLGFWADNALQPTFTHDPTNTPCEQTLKTGMFYCSESVQQRFPKNSALAKLAAESYLGIALQDSQGKTIGKLCILSREPIPNAQRAEQILRAFAARAAAELERQHTLNALNQLNQDLEIKVAERTRALNIAQTAMEFAVEGMFLVRVDGSFAYVNDSACKQLQYRREDLLNLSIFDINVDMTPDRWPAHWQNGLQQNALTIETRHRTKAGTIYPVEISINYLRLEGEVYQFASAKNISERKQLEAERKRLIQELSDFKFALDQSAIVATTDANGVITYVNDRFCDISGYSRQELIGKTHRLVSSDYHSRPFFKDLWSTITSGKIWRGEICNQTKNGKLYWVDSTFVPFLDAQGNPFQYLAIRFDVTNRRLAEQIIRQQVRQEKLLRETSQLIRQSLNLSNIFNTACQEICSVLKADRVAIFQFESDFDFTRGVFVAESAVTQFRSVIGIEVEDHCFGEDYSRLYCQGRFLVMDDLYGEGYSPCHTDILEQLQMRACMVLPLLYRQTLWGLLCIHQCAQPRRWQKSEIDLAQRLANQLAIAIQQANLYEQLQQELLERQQAQQQLTERNHELAISNTELARATRLKDEFLASMSHELRTPLNAILGSVEGLQDKLFGQITQPQRRALQTVKDSGTHLLALINDILDVAKIEAGQIKLEYAPTNVQALCRSSLMLVRQQALKKSIQVKVRIPPNLPDIWIDERRIRQVLINLLTNAVKFTPEGGQIVLSVTYQKQDTSSGTALSTRNDQAPSDQVPSDQSLPAPISSIDVEKDDSKGQQHLCITVTDTGIGIAPHQIKQLFEPFVQIDSALNRQYAGTGLGLALVKRLVKLHGGEVAVTSQVGQGSCFTIHVPCTEASNQAAKSNNQTQPNSSSHQVHQHRRPLVLLAEDNEGNRITLMSYLRARGYRLLLAQDGEQALTLAQSEKPDLILMDIQMPKLDGLEAIKQIRCNADLVDVPIIALTALVMPGDRERCLNAGANAYLSKPIELKQLMNSLQAFLA